jgi:CTP synthase
MVSWENHVNKLMHPQREIIVAMAGKYTHLDDSYISVLESLKHA